MSVGQALARLLADSGYRARQVGSNAWRIERVPVRVPVDVAPPPEEPPPTIFDTVPIIVTASKREQDLAGLPMAVSVVRFDDRTRALAPVAGTMRLAGDIDGLALTGFGPGRNRMFLRGISDSPLNGEAQSTVAVMLDDARLTYSAPDPDLRLVDVARVEVLKGPQGTLYGSGALGGIYHVVTRRAVLDETAMAVSLGAETVMHGGAGHTASAMANLPLVNGRVGLRLVGYSAHEAGWVDTGSRANTNVGRVLGGRANLGVDAGDGWRLDLGGMAQALNSRDSQYVYAKDSRSRAAQLAEPHDNDLRHLSARLARERGGVDIVLGSAVTWHTVDDRLDATRGAAQFGLADPQQLDDDRKYRVWDSEARLSGAVGEVEWLLGLSHVEARQHGMRTLSGNGPAARLVIDDDRRDTIDNAAFGDVTLPLGDALRLSLGGRLFRSNVEERRRLSTGPVSRERRRSGLTPGAALAWTPRAGRMLYLRYGSAFRLGGVDITASGALEALRSDELETVEAGWRERLASGGQVDLGVFFSRWRNLQSDVLSSDSLIETENAGDARILGLEVSVDRPLAGGWRMQAGVAWMQARLVRNALGYRLDDLRLPVVPDYTLRGAVERDFPVGRVDAAVRLQVRYLGRARLSFDPALDRPMGKLLETRVEGHADLGRFTLTLAIDNLLGRHGDTFAFGNILRFPTEQEFTPQRPRTFSLAVARRF